MKMKKFLKLLLIILISLGLFGLLAELILRKFAPQKTASLYYWPYYFNCFKKGEYYYISLAKDKTCILKSGVDAFPPLTFKTNNWGLRGKDIETKKADNTYRILFIGDSITMGWGVADDKIFTTLVEKKLRDKYPGKNIEVINAGVPATAQTYAYLFLTHEGLDLKPDLVVVELYPFTDLGYELRTTVWNDTNYDNLPDSANKVNVYVNDESQIVSRDAPLKFKIPVLKYSHLVAFISDRIFPVSSQNTSIGQPKKLDPVVCLYKDFCHDLDDVKAQDRNLFNAMKAFSNQNGAKFMVYMIPSEFSLYNNFPPEKYPFASLILPWEKGYPRREFGTFFKDNNIDYVDLGNEFGKHLNEKTFFLLDDHWNSRGHEIAAEALVREISNGKYIPPAP